jgi:hypothetical protein
MSHADLFFLVVFAIGIGLMVSAVLRDKEDD